MMQSFYFYDLETSGLNPREARIMQFAAQRTDMDLKPIGDPHNIIIKLTEDVVPEPDAVLITGITPQKSIAEGITEAEFLRIFQDEISTDGTIFVGYNTVRFDDEFMRYLHYRNFYDPYEWQWVDGRSRWDLLDVVRMTRALRPEGLEWPVDSKGAPTNRLELLTSMNGIEHSSAHDALSDVNATIGLANLIKLKQPKLFDYLLGMRGKKEVATLANSGQPFLYASGKYSSDWEKTTAVAVIAEHPRRGVLVFDLRNDPAEYAKLSASEMAEAWQRRHDDPGLRLPIKTMQFNRCPAVAPLAVLDDASEKRLALSKKVVADNFKKLQSLDLATPALEALDMLEKKRQTQFVVDPNDVDSQLYDGFIDGRDKTVIRAVRVAEPSELADFATELRDERLKALLPLYKARNYPKQLSPEERVAWEDFCRHRTLDGKDSSRLGKYFARLGELAEKPGLTNEERYLLEELQLYGQSIMPTDVDE